MTKDTKCEQCGAYRYSNIPAAPTAPQPPAGEAAAIEPFIEALSAMHTSPLTPRGRRRAAEILRGYAKPAASVSGEAEPPQFAPHIADQLRRLPIDVAAGEPATVVVPLDLLEAAATALQEPEPTYRALKDEAGHWMAETKRLRIENTAITIRYGEAVERADALTDENAALKRELEKAKNRQVIAEMRFNTEPNSGTAETIQLARRREE